MFLDTCKCHADAAVFWATAVLCALAALL